MPIWSKLGLIMIVPTVATVVVGTSGLIDHLDTLSDAGRAHDLAILTQHSGELVATLQDERANAVLLLGAGGGEPVERYTEIYTNVTKTTDAAAEPYSRQRTTIQDVPANFTDLLGQIDQNLGGLPGIRSQVLNGKLKLTEAAQTYEGLIADLLDVRDSATQLAGDTNLSERMRAASATARAKEFLSVRRVVVHRALIQGSLTPLLRTEYIATQTGQQQALQTFLSVSNQAEKESYEQTVAGPDLRESDLYSDWIGSTVDESLAGAPFTADRWDAAMAGNSRLIRAVEADLDGKLVAQADEIRSGVQRQVFLETGAAAQHAAAGDPLRLGGRPLDGPFAARTAPRRPLGRPVRPAAGGRPAARPDRSPGSSRRPSWPTRSPNRCRCAATTSSAR